MIDYPGPDFGVATVLHTALLVRAALPANQSASELKILIGVKGFVVRKTKIKISLPSKWLPMRQKNNLTFLKNIRKGVTQAVKWKQWIFGSIER